MACRSRSVSGRPSARAQSPSHNDGHSLGGLVIKQLFRTLEMEAKTNAAAASLLDRIDKVAFLATPHTAADLAVAGNFSAAV
jgi:hypothetical protein